MSDQSSVEEASSNGTNGAAEQVVRPAAPFEVMTKEPPERSPDAQRAQDAIDQIETARETARINAAAIAEVLREVREKERSIKQALELLTHEGSNSAQLNSELEDLMPKLRQSAALVEEAKSQSLPAAEAIRTTLDQLRDHASKIEALHARANDTVNLVAERSKHLEDAKQHADKAHVAIDTAKNQIAQHASDAEMAISRMTAAQLAAAESQAAAKASADHAAQTSIAVEKLKNSAESLRAALEKQLQDAAELETHLNTKREELATLRTLYEQEHTKIESLLPGATSAGLAAAFKVRRHAFRRPHVFWTQVFIASVVVTFLISASTVAEPVQTWMLDWFRESPTTASAPAMTWTDLGLAALRRLMFALPVIWLALYAARQAGQAKRVEEDYGFKEVMARSFEGFRKQMAEVQAAAGTSGPLSTLCQSTIAEITNPPGRIYDGERSDVSPLTAAMDTIEPVAKRLGKIASKVPTT